MNIFNGKNDRINEFLPLSNPYNFKRVFSDEDNIGMLEHFVSSILKIPLEEVKGNLTLARNAKEAYNEVDVIFNHNGKIINIEFFMNSKSTE